MQIPVYVINLERRADRRAHVTEELARQDVSAHFVAAVDAQDPQAVIDFGPAVVEVTNRQRSRADYACVSSHRLCWRMIAQGDAPYGLVLEDDVYLAPGFAHATEAGWIPDDADIVKLETVLTEVRLGPRRWIASLQRHLYRLESKHVGAGGYILSRAAAERLYEETRVPRDHVDHILFNALARPGSGYVIYQLSPAPVIQGMYHADAVGTAWADSSLAAAREANGILIRKRHFVGGRRGGLFAAAQLRRLAAGWYNHNDRRKPCRVPFG